METFEVLNWVTTNSDVYKSISPTIVFGPFQTEEEGEGYPVVDNWLYCRARKPAKGIKQRLPWLPSFTRVKTAASSTFHLLCI